MTQAGAAVDTISEVRGKSATTVAFDFGASLPRRNVLYLFGAPGQERFWFLWDRLVPHARLVVLVDPPYRRLLVRDRPAGAPRTPFIVACNDFGGSAHTPAQIREALDLDPQVPLLDCDARSRESSKRVLITLVEHLKTLYASESALTSPELVLGDVPRPSAVPAPDAAELYREMRRDHGAVTPVVLDGDIPAWLVLGYRELHEVTGDPVLFSRDSELWNQWDRIPDDWPLLPMIGRRQPSILYTVGERHRERAATISDALEAVDPFELRAQAERFADELIDAACAKGEADLIGDYAALLPVRVLAMLYGFAEEQGPGLVTALNDMVNGRENALAGQQHLAGSMARLIADRKAAPASRRRVPHAREHGRLHGRGDHPGPDGHDGRRPPADRGLDRQLAAPDADRRTLRRLALRRPQQRRRGHERGPLEDTPTENVAGRWASRDAARRSPRPRGRSPPPRPPGRQLRPPGPHLNAPALEPAATTPTSPSATGSTAARFRRTRWRRSSRGRGSRVGLEVPPAGHRPGGPGRLPGPRPSTAACGASPNCLCASPRPRPWRISMTS